MAIETSLGFARVSRWKSTGRYPRKQSALLGLLGVLLSLTGCNQPKASADEKDERMVVSVTNPGVRDVLLSRQYVGEVQAERHVELRSRVKGTVEKVLVDEGMMVQSGDILFTVSRQEFESEVALARARLKSAEATVRSERISLEATRSLRAKLIVAPSEVEVAQAKLDLAEAALEETAELVSAAERRLKWAEIRAPFDGRMGRLLRKAGSILEEGEVLSTISTVGDVMVYFNVDETEALVFGRGDAGRQAITLTLADGTKYAHAGRLDAVGATVDRSTGTLDIRGRFPNPEGHLRHGSTVKVTASRQLQNALVIPQRASFEVQHRLCVYSLDQSNTVRLLSIQMAARLPKHFVVTNGLTSDDRILIDSQLLVREGQVVRAEAKDWATSDPL
jgi:membrane fusion protein (multidrug efflux system)